MIIGLVGKRKAGKDTTYRSIKRVLGEDYIVIKYAFGDLVKEEIAAGLARGNASEAKYHRDLMNDDDHKERYRDLMQSWGKFRRGQNSMYWIDSLVEKIQKQSKELYSSIIPKDSKHIVIVLTDVRHQNEADCMAKLTGFQGQEDAMLTIKVERPSIKRDKPEDQDISEVETDLIETDHTLLNDKGEEELDEKIKKILDHYIMRGKHEST